VLKQRVKDYGAPVIQRSTMQIIVALLVTEAELFAATNNAQDILYTKRIIESLRLQVQFPMILDMDNKGAVDLVNSYSVGGQSRQVETQQYFMRQLKEENISKVIWTPGELNSSDLYTKNLTHADFKKCMKAYVGDDKYMKGRLLRGATLPIWERVRVVLVSVLSTVPYGSLAPSTYVLSKEHILVLPVLRGVSDIDWTFI
jgi:hypothetical protein